jgi:hypothetical protein
MTETPTTVEWIRGAAVRIGDGSAVLAGRIFKLGAKTGRARAAGVSRWLGQGSGIVDTCLRWGLLYVAARVLLHVAPGPLHLLAGVWRAIPGAPWWACGAWLVAAYQAGGKPKQQAEPEQLTPEAVLEAVRAAVGEDRGVLLTALAKQLDQPDTKRVRQLLAAAGIPVADGVRTPAGNGPGVHVRDLPTVPSPGPEEGPAEDVGAGQTANTNANNVTVERAGEGMTIIRRQGEQRRYEVTNGR